MTLSMVDVSNHNGNVDYRKLRGVDIVAAKCTEYGQGITYADPFFAENRAGAKSIGAVFMPYHFGHPGISAAESFAFFATHAGLRPGDLYGLDFEVSDGLTVAECAAWGSAYAHTGYGATGRWPWAYSDQAFIEAGNFAGLRMCPLWVAVLGPPSPTPPLIPGWVGKVTARQYTWDGRDGLDTDEAYLSRAQLGALRISPHDPGWIGSAWKDLAGAERELGALRRLLRKVGRRG